MRLAVVSPFVDRQHGTERALAEVLERLARDYPCEVHLFAQHVEDLFVVNVRNATSGDGAQIVWHPVPAQRGPHVLQFLGWYFRNRAMRRRFVRQSGKSFDLVLSPGINCSDADVIIVHALFRRLRDLATQTAASGGVLRALHRKIYYALLAFLERRIYGDPGVALAAVSPRTQADLAKYFNRQDVAVIPNAVDAQTFSREARLEKREEARAGFGYSAEEFVLLLMGNDWTTKGLPALLNAVARLPEIPLRVLAVGADDAAPFRRMAEGLGVLQKCRWQPASAGVMEFYAAADAYVSPSLEDSFGMPVSEAMACGLPAITSSAAGIAALLEDDVDAMVLRDPRDAQALAARLQEMYANIERREEMGKAAAKKAGEWTWDHNAAQVWQLLNAARARKSRASEAAGGARDA